MAGRRKNWREIMQTFSTCWRVLLPKEAQNTPTQGEENGDLHG
jgi:hypothetical protein